jgi:uncharacterized protein (DUF169 family)
MPDNFFEGSRLPFEASRETSFLKQTESEVDIIVHITTANHRAIMNFIPAYQYVMLNVQ